MNKKTMLLCLLGAGMMWMPMTANAAINGTTQTTAVPDDHEITGTVEDASGPMIGATIKVVGTAIGTVTDFDGKFTLKCKPGDMLEVSYIGYTSVQVKASQGMKVMLSEDNTQLSEVVVTALGIKRERKALGYGVSEVKGEELTKAKETNVINSLSGKVAGLVVQNTAGGSSGSTRVLLRGNTEMNLELIDVDPTVLAQMLGQTKVNGITVEAPLDQSPYFAVAFRVWIAGEKDGERRYQYFWYAKGKFSVPETGGSTKTESIEFGHINLTAQFAQTIFNGIICYNVRSNKGIL